MQSIYRILLVLLLSSSSLFSFAQSVYTGIVVDAETKEPLNGVLVLATGDSNSTTYTYEDGHFQIAVGSVIYAFILTGYETQYAQLEEGNNTIELIPSLSYFEQVVVSGNKTEKRITEVTVSLDIIEPELISKKNVIKVENVLQQVSSLSVTDKQVNIRNSSGWSYGAGSRVMILQDGMPMLSGDAGQPQWTFINTDNVKSIEVLKGASSVLYGSSALGGIIHIRTALPVRGEKPLTQVQGFGGLYSKAKREGLHWSDKPLTQKGVRILDSRRVENLDLVSNLQVISDDGYRFGDFEDRFRAGVLARYRSQGRMIFSLNTQVMSNRSASFLLWQSYDSAYSSLDGVFTENKGLRVMIDPRIARIHRGGRSVLQGRYFRIKNEIDNNDPTNDQSNSSHVWYGEYQLHQRVPFINAKAVAGFVMQSTKSNSALFQGEHTSSNRAYYLQLEKEFGALRAVAGIRNEKYTLDDYEEEKPVFRFGLNYAAGKATFARASFGQGYRFPTIAESFIKTNVGDLAIYPNEDLKSEFGNSMEIGFKQGLGKNKAQGFIDVALFRMEYEDMMEFSFSQWSKQGLGVGFKSLNVGKTRISGVELSGAASFMFGKHTIKFFGGYTYSKPISLEPDKIIGVNVWNVPLSYDSTSSDPSQQILKYRYTHLVRFDLQYEFGRWQFGLSTRYNSFMDNIDRAFVSFPINLVIQGIEESRTYNRSGDLVFDVRMSYNYKKYEIGANVLNLANREVVTRPADMGPPRYSSLYIKVEL